MKTDPMRCPRCQSEITFAKTTYSMPLSFTVEFYDSDETVQTQIGEGFADDERHFWVAGVPIAACSSCTWQEADSSVLPGHESLRTLSIASQRRLFVCHGPRAIRASIVNYERPNAAPDPRPLDCPEGKWRATVEDVVVKNRRLSMTFLVDGQHRVPLSFNMYRRSKDKRELRPNSSPRTELAMFLNRRFGRPDDDYVPEEVFAHTADLCDHLRTSDELWVWIGHHGDRYVLLDVEPNAG